MLAGQDHFGGVPRACPVCGGERHEPLGSKGALHLVSCSECSMVFASPVPETLTDSSFYQQLAKTFYLSQDKLESDYAPVRFEREVSLFRRFCQSGRVLDVGCSTGAFLIQLKTRWPGDYELLGTDVVPEALEFAKNRGIPVLNQPFLEYAPENSFDAMTFWAVLEHLLEPAKYLTHAARLLKPGGYCFILVPNFRSLAVRLLGMRYRYLLPEHLNYFTGLTLRKFVEREPVFSIEKLSSTHLNPMVIWQDWRAPQERVPDAERAALLKRTTGWKQNPLLKPVKVVYRLFERALGSLNLADNILVVLRKNSTS